VVRCYHQIAAFALSAGCKKDDFSMDKRTQKRHKRHVARARAHIKLSEPDVRTPEQLAADKEASRPAASSGRDGLPSSYSTASTRGHAISAAHSASKSDA
jgi:hypothetical protein